MNYFRKKRESFTFVIVFVIIIFYRPMLEKDIVTEIQTLFHINFFIDYNICFYSYLKFDEKQLLHCPIITSTNLASQQIKVKSNSN
jgi:hypothetical protein